MPLIVSNWLGGTPGRLARELGWKRARPSDKRRNSSTILNWGTSHPIFVRPGAKVLNDPSAVRAACSKLSTFRLLKEREVPCMEFTQDKNEAKQWLENKKSVVCRDILTGKQGEGIRIINSKEWRANGRPEFQDSRLYTKYFPKVNEYRIHVFKHKCLGVYEKKRKFGQPADFWVRTHNNGWIYALPGYDAREFDALFDLGRLAVQSLKLDFGAVDVGVDSAGSAKVFEVNTAPGLEGRTLAAYVTAINEDVRG